MDEHSSNHQQSDQHLVHKQMLDTNAFSDLSRNTTSSGLKIPVAQVKSAGFNIRVKGDNIPTNLTSGVFV
jgi:hypothetical protein